MAKQVQLRRGTTAEHSTFTGAVGELTVDTTKDTVVVHDGALAGGVALATEANVLTNDTDIANLTNGTTKHTGFNSTGIDDNATSTAITIDASENVGIGDTTPAGAKLKIVDTGTTTHGLMVEGNQTSGHLAYLYTNSSHTGNMLRVHQDGAGSTGTTVYVETDGTVPTNNILDIVSTATSVFKVKVGGDVEVNTGNLVIGTAGKGIGFGSTAADNTLDDYEEGTWIPTPHGDATGVISSAYGHYVKIGATVTLHGRFTVDTAFTTSFIGGLPFTVNHLGNTAGSGNHSLALVENGLGDTYVMTQNGGTYMWVRKVSNNDSHIPPSGNIWRFMITYTTAA